MLFFDGITLITNLFIEFVFSVGFIMVLVAGIIVAVWNWSRKIRGFVEEKNENGSKKK